MLFRRLEDLYEASETPWLRRLGDMQVYPRKTRRRAREGFNRRVELARHRIPSLFGSEEEWLTEDDASVLKVCHAYRNLAYHEDTHNPNVIASIARMHYAVVARLFAHLQPAGVSTGSTSKARIEQLAKWGYETGSMLNVREAADVVAEHISDALPVDPSKLRDILAEDLEERAESVREDVRFLAENTVIDPARIVEGAELSAYYSADEELLELQDQFDPYWLVEQDNEGVPREDLIERAREAVALHRERMDELEREHQQRVTLGLIDQADRTASRLRRIPTTNTTRMLVTYQQVDSPLFELERYVRTAVYDVDREIQRQIDIERGK